MRALAGAVAIAPGQAGFSCFDPTLSQRLTNAAGQAEAPATLTLREAAFNEGPAGVANAVKKLWENIGSYLAGSVRYLFSGGNAAGTTKGGDPITGRDLIALLATIGIDLGLLALAALNPPPAAPGRRDGLSRSHALFRLPTSAVVRQITAAIETAIEHAPGTDLDWARRHFIHHRACSYFVIPNIYSVDPADKEEHPGARHQSAGRCAKISISCDPCRFHGSASTSRRDETRSSYGLIPAALKERHARVVSAAADRGTRLPWQNWLPAAVFGDHGQERSRNHGLLSKAQRGASTSRDGATRRSRTWRCFVWSIAEGLTPLLALFNAATLAKGAEGIEAVRNEQEALERARRLQIADQRSH